MRDRSITNWFGENIDEQEKRRQWLRGVYDNAKSKEPSILDKAGYMANGAIQGLSLGYGDEIEGAISGLGTGAVNGFIGNLAGKASSPLGKRFFMDKNRRGLSDGLFENIGGKGSDAFIEKLRNIFKL